MLREMETSKLKTLEEIRLERRKAGVGDGETFEIIKQEAINWVKMLEKRISQGIAYEFERSRIEWGAQIAILRIFHNITEEDLK